MIYTERLPLICSVCRKLMPTTCISLCEVNRPWQSTALSCNVARNPANFGKQPFALQESIQDGDGKEATGNTQQNAGEQDAEALLLRSPNTSPIPPSVQQHNLGERRTNSERISYRRPNRDYSKSITWTYELNKDVYDIYIRVKSDGSGYMKRMKQTKSTKSTQN